MVMEKPDMRGKLAARAFALYSERGIDRVTMDDVAASAGVTKGSLYWHYRSKSETIHAACRFYYDSWRQQIESELVGITSARAQLEKAVKSSVRTCLIDEKNRTFTLELFTLSLHDEDIRRGWRDFFDGVKEFYVRLLKRTRKEAGASTAGASASVDLMLAAMEGYKLRALFEPGLCTGSSENRIAADLLGLLRI